MRQRSAKQRDLYEREGGRRDFVARRLAQHPMCMVFFVFAEAKLLGRDVGGWRPERCGDRAVHVHEILRRSAGGDILDERNTITTCAYCHRRLHARPKVARELGLLWSRYEGRNDE